jgi:thymidylate kinase
MHIIFSGMDGSGKSTQIRLLAASYNNKKVRVLWARGGYTPTFKAIKRIMKLVISYFSVKQVEEKSRGRSVANDKLRIGLFGNKLFVRIWLAISIIDLGIYLGIYLRYLKFRGFIVINDRCHIDTEVDFLLRFPECFDPDGLLWRSIFALVPRPNIAFLCLVDPEVSIARSVIKKDQYADSYDHLVDRYSLYKTLPLGTSWDWCRLDCTNAIDDVRVEIKTELSKIYENRTT